MSKFTVLLVNEKAISAALSAWKSGNVEEAMKGMAETAPGTPITAGQHGPVIGHVLSAEYRDGGLWAEVETIADPSIEVLFDRIEPSTGNVQPFYLSQVSAVPNGQGSVLS